MPLSSQRFFYIILLPLAVLLVAAWLVCRPLVRREAELDRQLADLQASLANVGHGADSAGLERQAEALAADTARLREIIRQACSLDGAPLVVKYGAQPFQLIEFEQERAAASAEVRAAATKAGVAIADSAFGVLNDVVPPGLADQSRRRWAQLALARIVADQAVAAKVTSYEALPVPAVREVRLDAASPALVVEVSFGVRVTGSSARVHGFLEQLVLGKSPEKPDVRVFLEHVVLRKEGAAAPDAASATVVVSALLSPPQL